jgi:hypothetical protein
VNKLPFISSYQGETDYRWKGDRICIRHSAWPDIEYGQPWAFTEELLPLVGCIYRHDSWTGFPDPEFCRMFPEYVPAKITFVPDETRPFGKRVTVEYLGERPQVIRDPATGWFFSAASWESVRGSRKVA